MAFPGGGGGRTLPSGPAWTRRNRLGSGCVGFVLVVLPRRLRPALSGGAGGRLPPAPFPGKGAEDGRKGQAMARQRQTDRQAERTEAGEQIVVPGVRPLTLADRLAMRAAAPMVPKRNPYAAQKACDVGLFDTAARAQLDLVDILRAASSGGPSQSKED